MAILKMKIGVNKNILTVCDKWPKDYLCKMWGENVCSGVRYGCECTVQGGFI